MLVQVEVLRMKTSNIIKKYWVQIFIYPVIVCALFFVSCGIFNFLLVPPIKSTIIGVTMTDVKSQTENVDVLYMGSSRVYRSVNTPEISKLINKNVFNVAYENANFFTTYYLLQEVLKTNQLETLYLEVSMTNFTRDTSSEDVFVYNTLTGQTKKDFAKGINLDYNNFKLLEFTNYLKNFSNGRFVNCIKTKVKQERYLGSTIKSTNSTYKGNGYIHAKKSLKSEEDLFLPGSYYKEGKLWSSKNVSEKQLTAFNNILSLCEQKNINVILFSPPYPNKITKENSVDFNAYNNYLKEITQDKNIIYLDFSKLRKEHIELNKEYFYNANHNNGVGASKLAPVYSEIYNQMSQAKFNEVDWFYLSFDEMIEDYN